MLTDKKIRFHISTEISNEIKIQMRYLACMVFISMSLKSMISLVWVGFELVSHTKETVGLAYEVYTVTYLRGYWRSHPAWVAVHTHSGFHKTFF